MTGETSGAGFDHGVASFDPTDHAVLIWTRPPHPGHVRWWVATEASGTSPVRSGEALATEDTDLTVTIDVDGLDPATTYFYGFSAGDVSSPIGRTRTLPGAPTEHLRLGITCCADYSAAPLGVYRALGERELDAVLHLGDYIYEEETTRSGRRAEFHGACTTVEDYRARYAQLRADPDARYLHARHPMITIWDDHDLADNAWRTGAKAHDPEEHGDWRDRVAAAARARAEWLPIRYREPNRLTRTWRSSTIGDLAEIILLDTRFEGRDRHAGDEDTPPRDDPSRSLLGEDQRRFLRDRLDDTTRPWTLVASGVVINEIALPLLGDGRLPVGLLPNGYAVIDGQVVHDDQWDGYTAERDHLVGLIEQRAGDGARTLLLSGDVHSCWAFEGPPDRDGDPVAVEAVCPAVSSAAMGRANLPGMNRLIDHAARRMPQVQWSNVTERGYVICDLDPTKAQIEWWIVDPYSDEPAGEATCAAVRVLPQDRWPCRFDVVDETDPEAWSADPARPDVPDLPDRPDDLARIRVKRFVRLGVKGALALVLSAAAAGVLRARRP